MKKVIILSYYAPPCSLTASLRIDSWLQNFNKYNVRPILITRKWEKQIETLKDLSIPTSKGDIYIKYEKYDGYYLECSGNFKDKIYYKYGDKRFILLRKSLSFFELIMNTFSIYFIPYKNFYYKTYKMLKENNDIDTIIISAGPFHLFQFGYRLKRKFPRLSWIADYRDDWSTSEINIQSKSIFNVILNYFEKKAEKRWLNTCDKFITISDFYRKKISKLINKEGKVIYNGYDISLLEHSAEISSDSFEITYNGSVYHSQNVEDFLSVAEHIIKKYKAKIKIKFNFIGTAIDNKQSARFSSFARKFPNNFLITKRLEREKAILFQMKSDLLLMLSHKNLKGIPSSKIFEYVGLRKRFILFPNDFDILEEIANESGLGIISNSKSDLKQILINEIENKLNHINKSRTPKINIQRYSSQEQVEKLVSLLH